MNWKTVDWKGVGDNRRRSSQPNQIVFHSINARPLRIAVGIIIIIGGIVLFPVKVK